MYLCVSIFYTDDVDYLVYTDDGSQGLGPKRLDLLNWQCLKPWPNALDFSLSRGGGQTLSTFYYTTLDMHVE